MELIKHDAQWFLSEYGSKAYSALKTLEERSVFLYSYLKQIAKADFEEDQLLFRVAFFFADAVSGSALPYNAYPALIDPAKNPFVAYLKNTDSFPGGKAVYGIFLSILHGIADPFQRNNWVYSKDLQSEEVLEEKLAELGKDFVGSAIKMADPDAYAIDEALQPVQLKLIWLMGQLK